MHISRPHPSFASKIILELSSYFIISIRQSADQDANIFFSQSFCFLFYKNEHVPWAEIFKNLYWHSIAKDTSVQ
jgi:hypothetical protein